MKKLIFATLWVLLLAGCEGPEQTQPQPPKEKNLVGTWISTREYSEFKNYKSEKYIFDVDVEPENSYRLTLNPNGKGVVSFVHPYDKERSDFSCSWQQQEEKLIVTGDKVGGYRPFLFFLNWSTYKSNDWGVVEIVCWEIEDFTANRLVLYIAGARKADYTNGGGSETTISRYTFVRVE